MSMANRKVQNTLPNNYGSACSFKIHPTVSKKSMKNLPFITTYHTYDVSC